MAGVRIVVWPMTSNKVDTPLHYEAPLADVVMVLTAMAAV